MKVAIRLTVATYNPPVRTPEERAGYYSDSSFATREQAYREIAYIDPRDNIERHLPQPTTTPDVCAVAHLFSFLLWEAQVMENKYTVLSPNHLDILNRAVAAIPLDVQAYSRRNHPHKNWAVVATDPKS